MSRQYDSIVLGAGPGGYVCAIRMARRGLKVALVEKDLVGGTCLNRGCVPTKILIESMETYRHACHAGNMGVDISQPGFNYQAIAQRRDAVVSRLRQGIHGLVKAREIDLFSGSGMLKGAGTVETGDEILTAPAVVLATGSRPAGLPGLVPDGHRILSSDDALALDHVPESVVIVGGGVIGCEFAALYSGFGKKVELVEMEKQILPAEDRDVSRVVTVALKKAGVKIHAGNRIESVDAADSQVRVQLADGRIIEADVALVSIGRAMNTDNIGLESCTVAMSGRFIDVDDKMRTSVDGVYAIGDITGKAMLAHAASAQGVTAAEVISGHDASMDYSAIPAAVFTFPEVGIVGLREHEAKEKGIDIVVGKFPFRALGRAHAMDATDGFAKVIAEKSTGRIIGIQVAGARATDILAAGTMLVRSGSTLHDLETAVFAHPTMAEAIHEACEAAMGLSTHLP